MCTKAYNNYALHNGLGARSTDDYDMSLWARYLALSGRLDAMAPDDPERPALELEHADLRYAIACVDTIEELASMFYYHPVQDVTYDDMRKRLRLVRENIKYAKAGGRFQPKRRRPPSAYRMRR